MGVKTFMCAHVHRQISVAAGEKIFWESALLKMHSLGFQSFTFYK